MTTLEYDIAYTVIIAVLFGIGITVVADCIIKASNWYDRNRRP